MSVTILMTSQILIRKLHISTIGSTLNHVSQVGPRNSARCQTCLSWAVNEIKKSDGSLQINRSQCQLLSAECQRLSAECQCLTRLLCKPSLCRRLCAVRNALKLVQDCCTENWLLKAVELGNCQEHFREVLLDLRRLNEPTVDPFDATDILAASYESDKTELKRKVQSEYEPGHYLANQLMEEPVPVSAPPEISKHLKNFDIYKTPLYPVVDVDREGDHVVVFRVTHASKEFIVKMRWSESKSKLEQKGPELVREGPEPLQSEANTMKKCRHPYTVGLVGYWEVRSRDPMVPLLLMESMDCNLRELIDKRSKTTFYGLCGGTRGFPALYAINLVLPVAKALRHLHSIKVVHRDLKPQNILYTHVSETQHLPDYFSVKLADFGDARNVEDSVVACKAGTNGYMDPDVYYRKNIDLYKADVFSFGLVFGEVLTGVSPAEALDCMSDTVVHGGHSPFVLAGKFYDKLRLKEDRPGDRPPLPKDTPEFVKSIVKRCCDPNPAMRPSFETICEDLLQYLRY